MIDLHSHILPGVDDGAPDLEAAVDMARIAVAEGISTVVATPHTLDGVYDVARHAAQSAATVLRLNLARLSVALRVEVAAEVRLDPSIAARLVEDPTLSLDGGGRYLLLELPHQAIPEALPRFLFELEARGTTPVIAHPERNAVVRGDLEVAESWVEHGALLQVTAGSLDGSFGRPIFACCERLLRRGLVHAIATDAHGPKRRPPRLTAAVAKAASIVGDTGARQLVVDNPGAIVRGEASDVVSAPQARRRRAHFLPLGRR